MTKATKQLLLVIFDSAGLIAIGQPPSVPNPFAHHSGKGGGGSLHCDVCGLSNSAIPAHAPECFVGMIVHALVPLLPPFYDRQKWLDDPTTPVVGKP